MKVITELKAKEPGYHTYGLLKVVNGQITEKTFSDGINEFPDYRGIHKVGDEIYSVPIHNLSDLSEVCYIYTSESHPEMFI